MKRLSFVALPALVFIICFAGGCPRGDGLSASAFARQDPDEGRGRKCSRGYFHLIEGLPVRRVEFQGNAHVRDVVIRRKLLLKEDEPFTAELLRASLGRFNKLGLFEKVTEEDVQWCVNEKTGQVDFYFEFTEKPRKRRS
jgi:outer membrane protein assembly factor BamA